MEAKSVKRKSGIIRSEGTFETDGDLCLFMALGFLTFMYRGLAAIFLLQQLSLEGTMVVVLHFLAFKCLHALTSSFLFCGVVITTIREILLPVSFALLPLQKQS